MQLLVTYRHLPLFKVSGQVVLIEVMQLPHKCNCWASTHGGRVRILQPDDWPEPPHHTHTRMHTHAHACTLTHTHTHYLKSHTVTCATRFYRHTIHDYSQHALNKHTHTHTQTNKQTNTCHLIPQSHNPLHFHQFCWQTCCSWANSVSHHRCGPASKSTDHLHGNWGKQYTSESLQDHAAYQLSPQTLNATHLSRNWLQVRATIGRPTNGQFTQCGEWSHIL